MSEAGEETCRHGDCMLMYGGCELVFVSLVRTGNGRSGNHFVCGESCIGLG